jgi:hypothetical protein
LATDVRWGSEADLTASKSDFQLPLKADSTRTSRHVRFVPKGEIEGSVGGVCQHHRTVFLQHPD